MVSANDTTEMQIWTIKPTPLERAMGRLMRGPDGHDSGDSGGGDAGAEGADNGGDAGAEGGDGEGEGSGASDEGNGSLVGDAGKAASGDGDGEGGGEDGGDTDKDDKTEAAAEVPEAYELKVTSKDDEGKDVEVEIDTELLAEATPIFKDLKLSNEQANALAPLALKVQERFAAQQADAHEALKTDWAKEVKADPDIGGKNWKETEALVARALDTFGAPSQLDDAGNETNPFRKLLNDTGLGNHPVMVRMFREIGDKVGEGGECVRGDKGAQHKPDRLQVLYPEDVPK